MVIPVHEKIILCGRLIDVASGRLVTGDVASGRLVTGDVVSGAAVNDVVFRRIVVGVTKVVAAKGDMVGKSNLWLYIPVHELRQTNHTLWKVNRCGQWKACNRRCGQWKACNRRCGKWCSSE